MKNISGILFFYVYKSSYDVVVLNPRINTKREGESILLTHDFSQTIVCLSSLFSLLSYFFLLNLYSPKTLRS